MNYRNVLQYLQPVISRPWAVGLSYAIIALVVYEASVFGGFVHDFLGWSMSYEAGSISDVLHCFGYNGLHQLLHLVFYNLYCWFGFWALPWFLIFTILHAFNALLPVQTHSVPNEDLADGSK